MPGRVHARLEVRGRLRADYQLAANRLTKRIHTGWVLVVRANGFADLSTKFVKGRSTMSGCKFVDASEVFSRIGDVGDSSRKGNLRTLRISEGAWRACSVNWQA
jgi:hypothetical protein